MQRLNRARACANILAGGGSRAPLLSSLRSATNREKNDAQVIQGASGPRSQFKGRI